jgi:hypothetical protein
MSDVLSKYAVKLNLDLSKDFAKTSGRNKGFMHIFQIIIFE